MVLLVVFLTFLVEEVVVQVLQELLLLLIK
jgi:hypothetical protein